MPRPSSVALFLALLALTDRATAQDAPLARRGDRMYVIGDSEAFLLMQELPALARASGVTLDSAVVPGSSVIQWSTVLHREWWQARRFRPDVLVVILGANDACMGTRIVHNEAATIVPGQPSYLERMLARIRRVRARTVVWLGPPAIGVPPQGVASRHPQAVAGLAEFATMIRGTGLPYFDARDISVGMWDDQLHCSRPRHQRDPSNGCLTWATWAWRRLGLLPDNPLVATQGT